MAGRYPTPVFLDATVLSNVASAGGISSPTTVLEAPVVVPAVRGEIERGSDAGDELPELRERLDAGAAESVSSPSPRARPDSTPNSRSAPTAV